MAFRTYYLVFFEQFVLSQNVPDYPWYNKNFPYLFNSYYETVGSRVLRTNRGNINRPGVEEVYRYRAYVDEQMQRYLSNDYLEKMTDVLQVIELGLQHEQQHQELLLYDIKYILGNNPLFPVFHPNENMPQVSGVICKEFEEIEGGIYQIDCNQQNAFCYDNELGAHQVFLHDFRIYKSLITNEEYLEFMQAGGYQHFKYWFSEAWEWVKQEKIQAPYYWHQIEGDWYRYSLD